MYHNLLALEVVNGSMAAMSNNDTQKFLDVALEAVKKAEPIFVQYFGKASGVVLKEGTTPSLVSDADKEIEKFLTREISTRFSEHAIVGEEFPATKGTSPFTWYIDPIDGTTNYIHGLAHCAISVGLWDAAGPLISIVSDPVNRVCYTAVRGGGAFKNGEKIRVSARGALKDCLGTIGWRWNELETGVDLLRRMAPRAYRIRVLSSSALELCLVAEGALDFYAGTNCMLWDVAAGLLVLAEAGGASSDWGGAPFAARASSLAASNGKIHEELLATLH